MSAWVCFNTVGWVTRMEPGANYLRSSTSKQVGNEIDWLIQIHLKRTLNDACVCNIIENVVHVEAFYVHQRIAWQPVERWLKWRWCLRHLPMHERPSNCPNSGWRDPGKHRKKLKRRNKHFPSGLPDTTADMSRDTVLLQRSAAKPWPVRSPVKLSGTVQKTIQLLSRSISCFHCWLLFPI